MTNAANGDRIKTDVSSAPAVKSHSRAELQKMIERSNACEKAVFAEDTPENCFAQLLATELNADVFAPDDILYANFDGSFSIQGSPDNKLTHFWSRRYW